ncbi:MAG: hypothetical protein OXC07_11290 [Kistimonas sp.]|nr:hypothetical protein [Kistimonas sp.]
MSDEHFTLTISQGATDSGDFIIHLKEPGEQSDTVLLHMQFAEHRAFDSRWADDIVATVARKLARCLIEKKGLPSPVSRSHQACEREAQAAVKEILDKMRGQA